MNFLARQAAGRINKLKVKKSSSNTAALVESVNDMDDLALQFDGTDDGKWFVEACDAHASSLTRAAVRRQFAHAADTATSEITEN